ncbi:MAG: ATP-binding cassette domain-containing protein [Alphaproteobacteria bacterium]|nr:ATP-binding cassette domain-containing protein [Alphaproteobacteria bacterium]
MTEPAETGGKTAPAIEVSHLTWRYPRASRPALSDISFTVRKGSCFGLLGPNGAGKSTLFSLLSGIRRPRQGEITVMGHSARTSLAQVRALSGLAPQDFAFYPALTGFENLDFFAGAYALDKASWKDRMAEAVEICQLGDHMNKRAEAYSGGLKRRLNLAIALLNKPAVLYLDEPTVGIDARSRRTITDAVAAIRRTGTTIVYTSHYMEEVEALCDEICIVNNGRIVSRGPIADYQQAGDPGHVHIRLARAPDAGEREKLFAMGAQWSDDRRFDAPAGSTLKMGEWLETLGALGLEAAQVRYGESRLEKVYIDLISDNADDGEAA